MKKIIVFLFFTWWYNMLVELKYEVANFPQRHRADRKYQ